MAALDIKDDKQKGALLLYQAGEVTQEISEALSDTGEDYKAAKEKLDEYFSPKRWLRDLSIPLSNTTTSWNSWPVCYEVTKTSSNLWISWCVQRNKIGYYPELPFETTEKIRSLRRHAQAGWLTCKSTQPRSKQNSSHWYRKEPSIWRGKLCFTGHIPIHHKVISTYKLQHR